MAMANVGGAFWYVCKVGERKGKGRGLWLMSRKGGGGAQEER